MKKQLIDGLTAKYKGEIGEAQANVVVYMNNPVGIGEHPDIIAAIDTQITRIAEAEDKLQVLDKLFDQDL
jgi:hypothetical protein|tara:strand:- start:605 stop:814 length:210 start_codon:yes stop_codon:yes gene_type:complete